MGAGGTELGAGSWELGAELGEPLGGTPGAFQFFLCFSMLLNVFQCFALIFNAFNAFQCF